MITALFLNMIPLIILVICGYILGKQGNVTPKAMADLLIHIISPFVTFGAVATMSLSYEYLLLPFTSGIIAGGVSFLAWLVSKYFFKDSTPNLIGLACVAGNITYFALPILILLLGTKWVGVYLIMRLGIQIVEMTWGYYIGARGNFTIKGSFYKLITFPPLYGVIAGLLWNIVMGNILPDIIEKYWEYSVGAIVFCGMMLMGTALAKIPHFHVNKAMISIFLIMRFAAWPIMTIGFILLDQSFFHIFQSEIHIMLALVGVVPLPINSIAYATKLGLDNSAMAISVTITTIFALFYIPLILFILGSGGFNILAI